MFTQNSQNVPSLFICMHLRTSWRSQQGWLCPLMSSDSEQACSFVIDLSKVCFEASQGDKNLFPM